MEDVNQDRTVYLVEVEDEDELGRWLAGHHRELFEQEPIRWHARPALWPRNRSLSMLRRRCSFELHAVVVDAGESLLEDGEFEG